MLMKAAKTDCVDMLFLSPYIVIGGLGGAGGQETANEA